MVLGQLMAGAVRESAADPAWQEGPESRIAVVSVEPQVELEVIDWGGHGASSMPESGYDRATLAADIRAVLDSLAVDGVALADFSESGRLEGFKGSPAVGGLMQESIESPPFGEIAAPTLAIYALPSLRGFFPAYVGHDDKNRRLAEAAVETLRTWAEDQVERSRSAVPHARIVVLEHANHHVFLTHEGVVVAEMTAFFEELDAKPGDSADEVKP
jgi:pimeloyl-ACP methyl ester carboxylesterase